MSSRSLAVRLGATAGIASAVVLGATFLVIARATHAITTEERYVSLEGVLAGIARERPPDLREARESAPAVSLAWYGGDGRPLAWAGTRPPLILGRTETPTILTTSLPLDGGTLVAAHRRDSDARADATLGRALALAVLPLAGLVALVVAWAARAALRPAQAMAESADAMASVGGSLPAARESELGRLSDALNRLLDRIAERLRREEWFAADAAHELRTPVAAIRLTAEACLLREREGAAYRQALRRIVEGCDRAERTLIQLLLSARLPGGEGVEVDLGALAHEAAERWREAATAGRVDLVVVGPFGVAIATEAEVGIVLDNLLGNAIRHSPEGGTVRIVSEERGFRVEDDGCGVPVGDEESIFERLRRLDDARPDHGGAGLGLSICRRLVTGRGGRIRAENRPSGGFAVIVQFP